jgi:hypothetical protein
MDAFPPDLTLDVQQEIEIAAPAERAFDALLQRLGPRFQTPAGQSLGMKLEPWPGGRWFRDLGDHDGHLWGHVQVFKRPTLVEICGPLFMSYPALSHVQFRITTVGGKSLLAFRHLALGMIQEDHRRGVTGGWANLLKGVQDDVIGK